MILSNLRIRWRRAVALIAATTIGAVGSGIAWSKHRIRAQCHCGIPCQYDYRTDVPSPPKRALSATAILLRDDSPANAAGSSMAAPEIVPSEGFQVMPRGLAPMPARVVKSVAQSKPLRQIRFYQLEQTRIQTDHCAVSRVAVLLQENGNWRISLQGDQNTPFTDEGIRLDTDARILRDEALKQTSQFRRNEFQVVVRGYADIPEQRNSALTPLGKPLMFRIVLPSFWVQKGQPRDCSWDGNCPDVEKYFSLVQRVEVDFSYR